MCYSVLVEQDLKTLEKDLKALADWNAFSRYQKLSESDPKKFKPLQANERIYPYYFAPIMINKQDQRRLIPMRYRIRPAGSDQEVPNKYNLYNARLDGLENRKTWKSIVGRQHGVISYRGFYEWVEDENKKKKVVFFKPKDERLLVSPVLFDVWRAADGSQGFASFAIVTKEPYRDVAQAGHDRSPIILNQASIDNWLNTPFDSSQSVLKLLNEQDEDQSFTVQDAQT